MTTDPSPDLAGEGSVYVVTIARSHIHMNMLACVRAAQEAGTAGDWWIQQSGPYLANGRNEGVRKFMPTGGDRLLFMDADMVATPDQFATIAQMCDEERPVVGGRYMNPTGNPNELGMVAYGFCEDPGPSYGFHRLESPTVDTDPDSDLCEVAAVGTGFMCIHRTILEKLAAEYPEPTPWFTDMTLGENYIGEDLAFCYRVRDLGYPVYLARKLKIGHYKELLI